MNSRILLHVCCAPCLIYPYQRLKEQGFEVTGLFYNPNVHPYAEYSARRQAVEAYSGKTAIEVLYPDYAPEEFFRAVNMKEARGERCLVCWRLRLQMTAQIAAERGCTHFTSTLLVSPYQDQETLRRLGGDIADEHGVEFYYEDFRPGFRKAHDEAKAQGIYCQKYCGCIYSEMERYKKPERKYP